MALSRLNVEVELLRRCRAWMEMVNLEIEATGHNVDLAGPIGQALRSLGVTTASIVDITDADVSNVPSDRLDEFLDVAEYRLLLTIRQNYTYVDWRTGTRYEWLSQMTPRLKDAIERKHQDLIELYGIAGSALDAGVVSLDFQQKPTVGDS